MEPLDLNTIADPENDALINLIASEPHLFDPTNRHLHVTHDYLRRYLSCVYVFPGGAMTNGELYWPSLLKTVEEGDFLRSVTSALRVDLTLLAETAEKAFYHLDLLPTGFTPEEIANIKFCILNNVVRVVGLEATSSARSSTTVSNSTSIHRLVSDIHHWFHLMSYSNPLFFVRAMELFFHRFTVNSHTFDASFMQTTSMSHFGSMLPSVVTNLCTMARGVTATDERGVLTNRVMLTEANVDEAVKRSASRWHALLKLFAPSEETGRAPHARVNYESAVLIVYNLFALFERAAAAGCVCTTPEPPLRQCALDERTALLVFQRPAHPDRTSPAGHSKTTRFGEVKANPPSRTPKNMRNTIVSSRGTIFW